MSQYTEVRKKLAAQRRAEAKANRSLLPPRKPPPAEFKEQLARIKAELEQKG